MRDTEIVPVRTVLRGGPHGHACSLEASVRANVSCVCRVLMIVSAIARLTKHVTCVWASCTCASWRQHFQLARSAIPVFHAVSCAEASPRRDRRAPPRLPPILPIWPRDAPLVIVAPCSPTRLRSALRTSSSRAARHGAYRSSMSSCSSMCASGLMSCPRAPPRALTPLPDSSPADTPDSLRAGSRCTLHIPRGFGQVTIHTERVRARERPPEGAGAS